MVDHDKLVGSIYDCAANPELWTSTLSVIRDELHAAYAMIGFADMSPLQFNQTPNITYQHSPWDVERLNQLPSLMQDVPGGEKIYSGSIDVAWTQLAQISRADFEKTHFNQVWAGPQGLSDCLAVSYVGRQQTVGILSCAKHFSQGDVFDNAQCKLAERLSPHLRRAMLINDVVDKGKLRLALQRHVLDSLTTPLFIVGLGGRLILTNAAGDQLLLEGQILTSQHGKLRSPGSAPHALAFEAAIQKAVRGDQAIGISGIGVPLINQHGERAAAYVLPIAGKDLRGDLGQGYCVVFVARRGEQQPMSIEILRTMFDLTVQEARVATLIAKGDGLLAVADALDVSINTVRSHLARSFAKTGTSDQAALGALVNQLIPPIAIK